MSHQALRNSTFSEAWLPDLVLHMPLDYPSDHPTTIELEEKFRTTGDAPSFLSQPSYARGDPDVRQTVPKFHAPPIPNVPGQRLSHRCPRPAQVAVNPGRDSRSGIAGPEDRVALTESTSRIARKGSSEEVQNELETCHHRSLPFSGHSSVADWASLGRPNSPGLDAFHCSAAHILSSHESILDRWQSQTPSEEPYTLNEDVHYYRLTMLDSSRATVNS